MGVWVVWGFFEVCLFVWNVCFVLRGDSSVIYLLDNFFLAQSSVWYLRRMYTSHQLALFKHHDFFTTVSEDPFSTLTLIFL